MRKIITIVFFLFIIASPFLGWITGFRTDLSENRVLARMPQVTAQGLIDSKFYFDLGKYHDDRFPYRGWLIKGRNWVDYHVFNTTPSTSKVYIGEKGWLFYTPSLNDYLKDSCQDKGKIRRLARKLHVLERMLEASGRRFIFVVPPNKATIYPEYVGLKPRRNGCGKSRYDLLLEAFEEFPVKGFVRLDHLLIQGKNGHQVYDKAGTHWNIHGAMIASEAILRKNTVSWNEYLPDVEISTTRKKFELENMLTMFATNAGEQRYVASNIFHKSEVREEEVAPLDNGKVRLRISARPLSTVQLLPRVLMYRDSFMRTPLKVIEGAFEQIDALWTYNIPTNNGVESAEFNKAKIVVVEIVERNLGVLKIDMSKVGTLVSCCP